MMGLVMAKEKTTPLMQQYFAIKEQYSDAILLFQVGDFYELFFEDAKTASSFLAIALTKRGRHNGKDIPLCGVPVHAFYHYLTKLVKGGFKVALCEQMSKPQPGKVVERAVTQVFTPGTLTDEQMLDDKSASYLLSFYPGTEHWGLVFTELLTAQLFATTVPVDACRSVESELARFFPDEIIIPNANSRFNKYFRKQGYAVSAIDESSDDLHSLWIENQFDDIICKRLIENPDLYKSISMLHWYLKKNQERALGQFRTINFYKPEDYLILDGATQRNLEIVSNLGDRSRKNTLFSVVDKAITPMGSRTIKKWLQRPLVQKQSILQRQEVVAAIAKNIDLMQKLETVFKQISDLERIVGRIALQRALLNDYLALKNSLKLIPEIKALLEHYLLFYLTDVVQAKLRDFSQLIELLECALSDDPSNKCVIREGFDHELDRLRRLVDNSQQEVLQLERREIERTGISSLKIRYNNVAGYYIEVTKANLKLVPEDYVQQQTLVNRNRYVTQELKDLERDIVKAKNEIEQVEASAFARVKLDVEDELPRLRQLAAALSYLDGLIGFARVAYSNNYSAPVFHDSRDIIIERGRHPVVELSDRESFIPNDTGLTDKESIWILTGPNMGGKSTYLRQVALICILAQAGGLVPAGSAQLPVLDRIFTRIGSGDNLAEGKSTFLVEMEETAVICNQATKYSLVILDEVGRGTSTFDGISLAQAIIEYIAQKIQARCLFATHYHELTRLNQDFECIENYHMASKQTSNGVLFLHKVIAGVAHGSFGLEVARLAHVPDAIVKRAGVILQGMGGKHVSVAPASHDASQIIALEQELQDAKRKISLLNDISLNDLTPREAFEIVWKMKEG